MATFNATFFAVQNRSSRGGEVQVGTGKGALGTTALTTSGTAQAVERGGSAWSAPADGYVVAFCDGAVRLASGETAATGTSPVGHYVPASQWYAISVVSGDGLSVIDA